VLVANDVSVWAKSDKIVTLQDFLSPIMKNKKDERRKVIKNEMSE